jgi:hypothetical protein
MIQLLKNILTGMILSAHLAVFVDRNARFVWFSLNFSGTKKGL